MRVRVRVRVNPRSPLPTVPNVYLLTQFKGTDANLNVFVSAGGAAAVLLTLFEVRICIYIHMYI